MSVEDLKAKFLGRTETITVRIPYEAEPVERLELLKARRQHIETEHAQDVERFEASHKLADTKPEEPDYTDIDAEIEAADRAVDEVSIRVTLKFQPGAYQEALNWGRMDDPKNGEPRSAQQMYERAARAYYVRTEGYEDGDWTDLGLSWNELSKHVTDGEMGAICAAAVSLATASNAAPFKKPSQTFNAG